jgi:hypothetical protein
MLYDYTSKTVREAAILTGSYVAGTIIGLDGAYISNQNQLVLNCAFTIGSLTTCEVKVEFSDDDVTYFQETFQSISGGTATETLGIHQWAATGNYRLALPCTAKYVKVSAKGTGTVTNSSLAITAQIAKV